MTDSKHTGAGYEKPLHTAASRRKIVNELSKECQAHKNEFDGFVVTGYSMAVLGSILADRLNKDLAIVRKDTDRRHSWLDAEGRHGLRWVFVDDLISSGDTLRDVLKKIKTIDGTVVASMTWHSSPQSAVNSREQGVPSWYCKHLVDSGVV